MKNFSMSLGAKLWSALVVVVFLLLATLMVSQYINGKTNLAQDVATATEAEKLYKIASWVGLIETNVARVTSGLVSTDSAVIDFHKDKVAQTIERISEIQKSIDQMDLGTEGRAMFTQIAGDRQEVLESLKKAGALKKSGDQQATTQEMNQVLLPAVDKYVKHLDAFADARLKSFAAVRDSYIEERQSNGLFAKAMVGLLLTALLIGTYFLIRIIRQPLRHAIEVANTIADGDLTVTVETNRADEFGEMMVALKHMRDRLVHLVADVRDGTVSITTASEEIAIGNHDLANRTEQTASNLQSTAASMEQLMNTVQHSSDYAAQANQLATSAAQVAQRGGDVVGQVVATMKEINTSSHRISEIISAIDGIAFQTNILALNAAVEAARAGEQGRGFAVVASEVRTLAGRSAEAAREIKVLINTSLEKVDDGTRLVDTAGATMDEIVSSVKRVSDIIGEISTGASEQVSGIGGVNRAVVELDQMTQQNSALVEQSAAAASSMKDQAHHLSEIVSQFKLSGQTQRPTTASSARVPAPPRPRAIAAPTPKAAPRPAPASLPKPAAVRGPSPVAASKPAPAPAPSAKAGAAADEWETF